MVYSRNSVRAQETEMFTVETEIAAYSARCDARHWRVRIARVAPACSHCGVQTANRAGNRDQTEMETEIKVRNCVQGQGARRTLNVVWPWHGLRRRAFRRCDISAENRDGSGKTEMVVVYASRSKR